MRLPTDGKKMQLPTGESDVIVEGFRIKGLGLKKGLGIVIRDAGRSR